MNIVQLPDTSMPKMLALSLADLAEATAKDETLRRVRQHVSNGGWPSRTEDTSLNLYLLARHPLSVWHDGSLLAFQERAIIPTELRRRLLEQAHAGHQGVVRTQQLLGESVWWPRLDIDVSTFIKDCSTCGTAEKSFKLHPAPLQPIEWPTGPWEAIAINIVGELQEAPLSSRFLLVITDLHSKWPEIFATVSITTETVCKVMRSLFARWGHYKKVISDNGLQFGVVFTEFLRARNILDNKISLYHPSANGQTERLNRTLLSSIRAAKADGMLLSDAITQFLEVYRSNPTQPDRQESRRTHARTALTAIAPGHQSEQ